VTNARNLPRALLGLVVLLIDAHDAPLTALAVPA
jgi:hypothetical protein